MRNRFNSSEPEKNRIRKLHKNNSVVINEQQSTPMGIQFQSCDPNTTPMPIDYPITLDGQPLTNGDVGTEISFPTNPGFNGKIDGIFPASNPNGTPINAISTPCPPPVMPPLGIVFQSCDPYTTPSQINANIILDGQMLGDLPNQGIGTEIAIQGQNQTVNGSIASVFIATQNLSPGLNVTSAPCPPPVLPPLGIVFASCDPNTTPIQIPMPITVDGNPVSQSDIGKEVEVNSGQANVQNGVIDSLLVATQNLNNTVDLISSPCPPPVMPPLGIVFGSCDPNTSPIQIPMPITINGVPVTQNDVGKEIEVNSGQANAQNGKIDSLLVATQNLSNSVDVIESPCPPPTTPSMGIELKLCGQPNTSPMSIDAAVTIDGQPVTQGDVGKEVSGGGPNTHGTVDSVFISMNPNQAAPFISKPCKPIIEPVDPCKEFSMLDRVEQRDICKKCKTDRRNPMCKCCEKFRP